MTQFSFWHRNHFTPALLGLSTALALFVMSCTPSPTPPSQSSGTASAAATTSTQTSAASKGGGTLVVGAPVGLTTSDPIHAAGSRDQAYLWTVYDTLLTFTPDEIKPAPGLAASWDQPDPKTLVLHLRPNVTFQDNTPLDSAAVKFNLERAQGADAVTKGLLTNVASVDATDPLTATLHLSQPDSSLLLALTDLSGMMVSPSAVRAAPDSLATTPVGAGRWKFVSQSKGASFIVQKWDGYWDKSAVGPDNIEFKIINDPGALSNALRSGQINMAINVSADQVDTLSQASGIKVQSSPSMETIMFIFNVNRQPLDNPAVRKAVDLAIDRQALVDKIEFGRATVGFSILPDGHWAYPKDISTPQRDVAAAKKVLADAGFPNGVTFQMIANSDPFFQREAEAIKAQLAEANINVSIIPLDLSANTTAMYVDQKYDSMLASFGGRQDPATAYAAMYGKTGFLNPGGHVTPGVDEAIGQANAATSIDTRAAALTQVGKALDDNSVGVVFYHKQFIVAYTAKVTGYTPNILGKPKFLGITAP